ncbi:hypothetical protein COCMIDRAFT_39808 [Bipolaris oryzae ATCC 44560]|uniref:Response regulatory domain-containing protein n=1 Tax=Bipolaris oryzae ATCC 44560 TaxID=930090 RepID=W6Z363_COCMI|nr:uncharacterized protein COCMIDRAFT_39808 [Bipolaris oryzae ATCC 44560]EUC42099.1 hypothetical protein COCMIDRAFT_39808 [Bipolaris oryzae ATCC 44560]
MLPQQVRLCLQALHISINEFSTFVASRGLDDDVVAAITEEGGSRLQDTLAQLRQLCELAEECMWPLKIHRIFLLNELPVANVLHEMRSPMQTAGSCNTVTLHEPLDMSQPIQEGRNPYQASPFESRSVDLERDKSFENLPVSILTRDLLRRGVHPIQLPRDPSLPPIGPIYLSDIPAGKPNPDLITAPPNSNTPRSASLNCVEPLDQFAHCKILIAEDNLINQRVMLKILGKLGMHNNVVVPDGQAAVDSVRELMGIYHPFDFIFMDESMPVLSGHEATRQIREMGFQGPICAMMVNTRLANKQRTWDSGATTIIQKPFMVSSVRNVLEQYLTPLIEEPIVDESPLPRRKPDIKSKL